jgi:trimeric intracellular cation channel
LACWVSAMLSCFAGGVLVAPLCGEPIMAAFADGIKVLIASVLWFLVYYTPHDLFYHVS